MLFFHKANELGLGLFEGQFNPGEPVCASTDYSTKLFWRNICIVLEGQEKTSSYTEWDSDSRSQTEWDEDRLFFSSLEDLKNSIKYIIISKRDSNRIFKSEFESMGFGQWREDYEKKQARLFLESVKEKIKTPADAKKINKSWDKSFLNLK